MTNEEVIKTLELAKAEVEWEYPIDYAVAIDSAIEIIKKQIPLKHKEDYSFDFCPVCYKDRHILVSDNSNVPKTKFNFCPYCGQKIDWSE